MAEDKYLPEREPIIQHPELLEVFKEQGPFKWTQFPVEHEEE